MLQVRGGTFGLMRRVTGRTVEIQACPAVVDAALELFAAYGQAGKGNVRGWYAELLTGHTRSAESAL